MELVAADKTRMNNVEELMKILMAANMLQERQQIDLLVSHIAETEKNHAAVMQELADIKEQLNVLLSRSAETSSTSSSKEILSGFIEQAKNIVAEQGQKLQNIKRDINQKAQHVVQNFKNIGIRALNNVCGFLGVQEKLVAMRDQARSSEQDMKNAVEKLDAVERELSGAASHIKNTVRLVSGKEMSITENAMNDQADKKRVSLFQMLRNHFKKRQNVYAKRAEKLSGSIEKCRALEQKASVLKKLSENKDKMAERDKNTGEDRSIQKSEHKREKNIR